MRLEPLLRVSIELGDWYEIGQVPKGNRNVVALKGGRAIGPQISGDVAPVGGEFELLDGDQHHHVDVRMVIVTDDGANIFVQYLGVGDGGKVRELLDRGEKMDFGDAYFVTQPRFETSHPRYAWLNHVIAVAEGRMSEGRVEYLMYHCIPDATVGAANAEAVFAHRDGA